MAHADVSSRRAVLFDFDGTLANTIPGITSTARTVLLAHGFTEETLGDLTRLVGPPFPQAFSMVYGLSEREAERVTEEYRAIYRDLGASAWPLFDGIPDLLVRLRGAGKLLAIASSKRSYMIERAVVDDGIADLFDVALGKPSDEESDKAKIVARAMRELGVGPDEAVMVGDRHHDVEAARACGIPCVGVTYGGAPAPGELEGAGAAVVACSVEELGRALLG